ncbi:MAG: hypothetical protein AB7S72_00240 [Draconibacterium sp.]
MEELVLKIKDKRKVGFLKKLLAQFDFVEIEKEKVKKVTKHSIFDSAGIWESRDTSQLNLREEAWKRGE